MVEGGQKISWACANNNLMMKNGNNGAPLVCLFAFFPSCFFCPRCVRVYDLTRSPSSEHLELATSSCISLMNLASFVKVNTALNFQSRRGGRKHE